MTEDQLSLDAHAALNMAVFPVAMCRLVLIHEIHINGSIGNLFIKLGQKMTQGFLVLLQADDPHLRRREGVHPGDHAGALRIIIGIVQSFANGCLTDQSRL